MSTNNLIKALQEGYELSPIGKIQLATYLVQEVMMLPFLSEKDSKELARIQYELWCWSNCGTLERAKEK